MSIHTLDWAAARNGIERPRAPRPSVPVLTPRPIRLTKQVHGFHPWWMGSSWRSYDWSCLSTIAWFGIELDENGAIAASHGWPMAAIVAHAHAHAQRVRVVPTFTLFDTQAIQVLLGDPVRRRAAAAAITGAVVGAGADGACLDFEGVPGARKTHFVRFVGEVQRALQAANPIAYLSVCTPAVDWANAYDYDALAARCNHLLVMAYDYRWAGSSTTGPVAPLAGWGRYNVGWTIQDYLRWGAPRDKMLLGVPWYGYRWPAESNAAGARTTSRGTPLTFAAAAAEAITHGAVWDAPSETPWLRYHDPSWFQIWYENAESHAAKYARVLQEDLAGVGIWALGYDGGLRSPWLALRTAFAPHVEIAASQTDTGGPAAR